MDRALLNVRHQLLSLVLGTVRDARTEAIVFLLGVSESFQFDLTCLTCISLPSNCWLQAPSYALQEPDQHEGHY